MSIYKNSKSQMTTIRVPHDVMEAMEAVKQDGESNAGFIVTAMRGEIARREMGGTAEDAIVSTLQAMAHIRDGAENARKELVKIIKLADKEIGE
ncbi:hypothetical protein I3B08_22815 [Salmonella enterica]|nr:hypothetical protein [Salmonella enterica]MBH0432472.1 hypothetical protein [Salmonella enterica]MBH0755568.1 hypothetical protein [Salmonella enterica]